MAITVDYKRVPGYPREEVTRNGARVIDRLRCDYTDRITLIKELLGFSIGGVLHVPHKYDPVDDTLESLYASTAEAEPIIGLESSTGNYKKAIVTVRYETPSYDVDLPQEEGETTYVTESLEPAAEFATLGRSGLYFGTVGGGDQKGLEELGMESPSKIIRMIDWVYTIHWMPFIPAAVWTHIGTVNSAAIFSHTLGKLFPAETLLCSNPTLTRQFTSEGIGAWEITWRFTYRPEGWNKFPRTDNAGSGGMNFENLRDVSGNAIPIYDLANFGALIY